MYLHAFMALLSVDKELSLDLTTRIQYRRYECTNKAVVWNCGVVCSAFSGCFHQESDHPTFYHWAVLYYKLLYSQEPWLVTNRPCKANPRDLDLTNVYFTYVIDN